MANRWRYDTRQYSNHITRSSYNDIKQTFDSTTDRNIIRDAVLLWIKTEIPVSLSKRLRINTSGGLIRIHNDPTFSDSKRTIMFSFGEDCVNVMQEYERIGRAMYCDPKMFDVLLRFLYKVYNG